MASQHRNPSLHIRPDPHTVTAARHALDTHGRHLTDFVTAALRELADAPDATLERLEPHWPPAARHGRPPKPE